jgi:hypothetical protein
MTGTTLIQGRLSKENPKQSCMKTHTGEMLAPKPLVLPTRTSSVPSFPPMSKQWSQVIAAKTVFVYLFSTKCF